MNPEIWRVCAGAKIPKLNSTVYYFPQGHADHSCLTHHLRHQSRFLCRVSAVHLLADPNTDEVSAKLLLIPVTEHVLPEETSNKNNNSGDGQILSFTKILTPSDANNGGGFSMPRGCALSILPELNLKEEKPTQFLDITDIHGKEWRFCHVYRGVPKRHLFTTGWSKFSDEKKLIGGDTIIFMKNSSGKLFVGIRRRNRELELGTTAQKKKMEESEKSVAEAVDKAARNMEFEVLYYPKPGVRDFVVDSKVVDEALKIGWMCGMRVKIDVETVNSSRIVSFEGTITSIYGSHWCMLQVEWEQVEWEVKHVPPERVSPWEVKHVSSIFRLPFLPTKKLKVDHHREGGDPWNQTLWSYDLSPIGIQGTRHNSFSSLVIYDPCVNMSASSSRNNSSMQRLTTVPTNVTLASYQSGVFSPDHSDSSNIASSSRNISAQGLTTVPTNVTLASYQYSVFSPDHSDSSNIASSSRNISAQGLTTVPAKVTLASSQSGVFSPNHSESSLNSFDNNTNVGRGPIRLFGETIYPDALNSTGNTAEGGRSSMHLFGTTIYTDNSDSRDSGCSRGSGDQRKGKNKIA